MTVEEALAVLGLKSAATSEEVRVAHRELAQMLHPDKFSGSAKLRARAEQQMRLVNEARDVLLSDRGRTRGANAPRAGSARASSGTGSTARGAAERTPRQIAFEAEARAHAAESARLMVVTQARTLRERRQGMVTLAVAAGVAMLVTYRMSGMLGTIIFSVASMLVIWGLVDIFTLSNQVKVLSRRARELMVQRDRARAVADGARSL